MAKTILITGGLGFIGSNLIRRLLKTTDYKLLIVDKKTDTGRKEIAPLDKKYLKRIEIVKANVTRKKIMENLIKRSNVIVHMAADTNVARSVKHATSTIFNNVIGTSVLLEAVVKYQIEKFIYLSSSEVYGDKKKQAMDENHPLLPVTPYAASKLAADRIAYSFFLSKKIPVIILRLFNAYGPYQDTEKMIPKFIIRLLQNQTIFLNHAGNQKRDWVYIEDITRALEMVINAENSKVVGEVFNIGTEESTSVKSVAQLIIKTLRKDNSLIKIIHSSHPGTMENIGISEKIKNVLGWEPQVNLEEGLGKTIKWYMKYNAWWENKNRV